MISPADHFLEILSIDSRSNVVEEQSKQRIQDIVQAYRESKLFLINREDVISTVEEYGGIHQELPNGGFDNKENKRKGFVNEEQISIDNKEAIEMSQPSKPFNALSQAFKKGSHGGLFPGHSRERRDSFSVFIKDAIATKSPSRWSRFLTLLQRNFIDQ